MKTTTSRITRAEDLQRTLRTWDNNKPNTEHLPLGKTEKDRNKGIRTIALAACFHK